MQTPPRADSPLQFTTVSLVVPVFRDRGQLEELLRTVRAQRLPQGCSIAEILVVETESREPTKIVCDKFRTHYSSVSKDDFDHAGTRTTAGQETTSDFVVFLSQDVLLEQTSALAQLVLPMLTDPTIAACYGRQVAPKGASDNMRLKREFSYPNTGSTRRRREGTELTHRDILFSNAFGAYRRDALAAIGWFGSRQLMCEDISAAARLIEAGHAVTYTAEAIVIHRHHESLPSNLGRAFDIGASHEFLRRTLGSFPMAGGVGVRFLSFGVARLSQAGPSAAWRIPMFVSGAALRWLAYSAGLMHRRLPTGLVQKFSLHPPWWRPSRRQ